MKPQIATVKQFIELIQQGTEAWIQAAELARAEIEKDEHWPEKVQEGAPLLFTAHAVKRFANIGIKWIPQLAISECAGAKLLRKLPLDLQNKYVANPLPLLIHSNGDWEILLVDLHNLLPDQAAQVFADDHVRSDAEQRAWIEDRKAKSAAPAVRSNLPYRIVGKEVVFVAGARIKSRELAQIMVELEK